MKKFKYTLIVSLCMMLCLSNNISTLSYYNGGKDDNKNVMEYKDSNINNVNSKAKGITPVSYESRIATFMITVAFGVFVFYTVKNCKYKHN